MKRKNRPSGQDGGSKWVPFGTEGSTWWGRVRNLGGHKGNKKEADFSHLHDKFTEEEA
jgi:hypothetical protein